MANPVREPDPGWLHGHPHEPNLDVPEGDGSFLLIAFDAEYLFTPDSLAHLPQSQVGDCYIVSTGHGTSGPFRFDGVRVCDFLAAAAPGIDFTWVDVVGADGFGTRLARTELEPASSARAPLLALAIDGRPLTRAGGLVRLIVPNERDDALKQVKWVDRVVVGANVPNP